MVLGPVTDNQGRAAYSSYVMLERMAAQALTAKDYFAAFKYADRRCRVDPSSAAHCFVLRAEANWRLERKQAAMADLAEQRHAHDFAQPARQSGTGQIRSP